MTVSTTETIDYAHAATAVKNERPAVGGDTLLALAAEATKNRASISAGIRQRVNMLGHSLAGSGEYMQQTAGTEFMFRFELAIQMSTRASTIVHAGNGRFLWLYEQTSAAPRLRLVDLRRVREAVATAGGAPDAPNDHAPRVAISHNGVPGLLENIKSRFFFDPPTESVLGEMPVWILRGHWRAEQLARILPEQKEAILAGEPVDVSRLPVHVPHEVVLHVGRDDFFPYKIEYWRRQGDNDETGDEKPMVVMELYEVKFGVPIDPKKFGKPAELPEIDHTDAYLKELGLAKRDP